ncbi:unnamed protein product [Didymodactylos carnosus]|uniref:Peroxidase n=1 Tax=Didymodactylos carnosus TaxID=1234261 RepID=A0A813W2Q4_9BILA|nr:unnamed protein product [Didymodactylos carnosus]CAF0854690.1 unnamed protein product [Didymodactylos carnosus]CAF3580750.1 unnamed protein product [Didymodactylos carnosus]CAF3642453.1 unnamed protein product [Didymodactylos carnosus]
MRPQSYYRDDSYDDDDDDRDKYQRADEPDRYLADDYDNRKKTTKKTFPDCLFGSSKAVKPFNMQNMFETEIRRLSKTINTENSDDEINDATRQSIIAKAAVHVSSSLLSSLFCDLNGTDTENLDEFLRQFQVPEKFCSLHSKIDCDAYKDRRHISGICNNLKNPHYGSAGTPFTRIKKAVYDDGLGKRRSKSVTGRPLPSARDCSLRLFQNKQQFSRSYTNYFVIFGQFIGHDMSLAAPAKDGSGKPIACGCNRNDDMCSNVKIPPNDPWMSDQKCMAIPATAEAFPDQICSLGIREQKNDNTHFIDLSVVYGSSQETIDNFREHTDGLLIVTDVTPYKDYLPQQQSGQSCVDADDRVKCDGRVMENLVLTGIVTQWWRFHNMLARKLKELHSDWSDDELFEGAKKINVGYFQKVVFDEYLPMLLGQELTDQFFPDGPTKYDPEKIPGVWTEFSTAAFRCHSLVREWYSRATPYHKLIDQKLLWDISLRAAPAWDFNFGGLDAYLRGSVNDFGYAWDWNFADQIRHHLFETNDKKAETKRYDLPAMNINRCRAHGISSYNVYREWCGYKRAKKFSDFSDTINTEGIQNLREVYDDPDDVDLFAGLNMEDSVPGGLIGKTSACIVARQFALIQVSDRFYYEHEGVFTPAQLQALKDFTHRSFMCDTVETYSMQTDPYKPRTPEGNEQIPCTENYATLNMEPWR